MPTPVVMPQMGESITEGTIVRWIKKVGDTVDRDEPLFEISTDKVDAEIPSPAAGVITSITAEAGETVPVDSVVATIGTSDEMNAAQPSAGSRAGDSRQAEPGVPPQPPHPPQAPTSREGGDEGSPAVSAVGDGRRRRSSPLVRRIAKEHGVDIERITGTGIEGRVTKHDILGHMGRGGTRAPDALPPAGTGAQDDGSGVEVRPLSVMRRKIAEHMVLSRRTSAHVHTVFHVDFTTAEAVRRERKAEIEGAGAKLTLMAIIAKAVAKALERHPVMNASLDGDNAVYRKDINLGIAVALETGLIVPVVKHAEGMSVLALGRAIADVADRARRKALKPDEVHGGTFTITNPGQFGAQFGMPIINQPQVAILGVGTIEKRPVVVDDAVVVRSMAYLTLGFDHRLIDGAVADQFMADVKREIEHFALGAP